MKDLHRKRRILYICPHGPDGGSPRPYFAAALEAVGFETDCAYIRSESSVLRALIAILLPVRIKRYDIVVVIDYFVAWGSALRALITGFGGALVVLGLNQSRKLIRFDSSVLEKLNRAIWRRCDHVVVHSSAERILFSEAHGIALRRMSFIHWGYDLPATITDKFANRPRPYVCMIGRNNRDVSCFCSAARQAGVDAVLITPDVSGFTIPEGIEHIRQLSLEDCLSCIRHSIANVILVIDGCRGAGHITAVNAMFLGVPQIFSDVEPLSDYLIDGFNGLAVAVGSQSEVVEAITTLVRDPELACRLGSNGRRFASAFLTNEAVSARLRDLLLFVSGILTEEELFERMTRGRSGLKIFGTSCEHVGGGDLSTSPRSE